MGEAAKSHYKDGCLPGWEEFEAVNHLPHNMYKGNEMKGRLFIL